jgi:zinc and cadmium transporter
MLLIWILGFSLLGSAGAVGGAALLLTFPVGMLRSVIPGLLSYAIGTLLGAAFLGLIPHALDHVSVDMGLGTVLAGLVLFFILEKLVIWRHCHDPKCNVHGTAGPLILIGDALHNFVDGIVIAAAFLTAIPLGVAAAVAVIVHEVPQEVGDFAILLDSGYSRRQAFAFNALSSLVTLPGALLGWLALEAIQGAVPYILALSAASFLYIGAADLIPRVQMQLYLASGFRQVLLLLAGIGTILLLRIHH